jgi:hypothetical protein
MKRTYLFFIRTEFVNDIFCVRQTRTQAAVETKHKSETEIGVIVHRYLSVLLCVHAHTRACVAYGHTYLCP